MSNEHENLSPVDALGFNYSEVERRSGAPRRRVRGPSGMLAGLFMGATVWALIILAVGATWNWYSHAQMVKAWEAKQASMLQRTCTDLIQYGLKMTHPGCIDYFEPDEEGE